LALDDHQPAGGRVRWLTAKEAAAYLGGVSVKEIYRARRSGALMVATIGDGDRNFRTTERWCDEMMLRRAEPAASAHTSPESHSPAGRQRPERAAESATQQLMVR